VLFSADRCLAFVPLLTYAHQPVYRLFSLNKPTPPTLFRQFYNKCSISKTNFPQCLDPSFIFVRYFIHNQNLYSLTAIMTWNIEEFRAYYNAMLHINIKIMTSQQRWYLLLNYFNNNKINFLFRCEICSWRLRFRQFDICQVNTAQSNTLVHSIVPNKWAKYGAKIFWHFWDIAIFVLGYFILRHPVDYCGEINRLSCRSIQGLA